MGFTNTAIGLRSGAAERRGCLLSYAGYEVPGGAAGNRQDEITTRYRIYGITRARFRPPLRFRPTPDCDSERKDDGVGEHEQLVNFGPKLANMFAAKMNADEIRIEVF